MSIKLTWPQALAWRMRRHQLDPIGSLQVAEIVRRLCGVQAQVASSAELAVRVRRETSEAGEVATALAGGALIKTWAMRGTLHLLVPDDGAAFLSLIAAARSWERPSWQRYFGMTPAMMEELRAVAREALDGRVLTRDELIEAVTARPGMEHIAEGLRSGWGTLLKPLAWQGDICFGANRGNRVTFTRPEAASPSWTGIPSPDEAGPRALAAYFGAYAPATVESFGGWLAGGWFGRKQLRAWFAELGDRVVEVDVEGDLAYALAEDIDELAMTAPTSAVRLLPGFDQYVLGPGTGDGHVVAAMRRAAVSRQSGWIAPVVVSGGVVCGTWELEGDRVLVAWFAEAGPSPTGRLDEEVHRLAAILGRDLEAVVTVVAAIAS